MNSERGTNASADAGMRTTNPAKTFAGEESDKSVIKTINIGYLALIWCLNDITYLALTFKAFSATCYLAEFICLGNSVLDSVCADERENNTFTPLPTCVSLEKIPLEGIRVFIMLLCIHAFDIEHRVADSGRVGEGLGLENHAS